MADIGGAHLNAGLDTGLHLKAHVDAGVGGPHGMVSPYGGYPSNVGPQMYHGHCHRGGLGSLGVILVLYILLVIILRGVR